MNKKIMRIPLKYYQGEILKVPALIAMRINQGMKNYNSTNILKKARQLKGQESGKDF